jgi:hypothetical protein
VSTSPAKLAGNLVVPSTPEKRFPTDSSFIMPRDQSCQSCSLVL